MRPFAPRLLVAAFFVTVALPAQAQFEGLDLGPKKQKKKKKTQPSEPKKEEPTKKEAPAATKDEPAPKKKDEGKELDLSGGTPAPKRGGGAAMSFDAVDVSGKTGDRQRIDAAIAQFKAEDFESAVLAFFEMSQDPKMPGLQVESEYWLAKSLYKLAMYHSALQQFSKVLATGPSTKFFKSSLEWLFFIARKTVNETVVLDEIAQYSNYEFPERFRNEFRYLLARYNLVRGKALDDVEQKGEADKTFEEVKRIALMIPKGDPFYARAKYLEGLAYFRENKLETALEGDEGGRARHPAGRGAALGRGEEPAGAARAGLHAAGAHPLRRPAEPLRHLLPVEGRARRPPVARSRCSRPPGPTTASASTSRRWATSSPCLALLPRRVLPRGADLEGGHLLRELPLPGGALHHRGLRAHLRPGAGRAGRAGEEGTWRPASTSPCSTRCARRTRRARS